MSENQIRFVDGGMYERAMGVWSRSAGEVFLDWLHPKSSLCWLDVGCGSGAFTQLIVDQAAPREVQGIDPSGDQLAFARGRPAARVATFLQGSAMQLPFPDDHFDAAVMALVLFFVPEPSRGASEMVRVLRPGGLAAAYLWDMGGGGFPFQPVYNELRAMGFPPPLPPSVGVSQMAELRKVWSEAGLTDVETRTITVSRTFADFDEFWSISTGGTAIRAILNGLPDGTMAELKSRVQAKLPGGKDGAITYQSVANAVKGHVPV